MKLPKKYKLLLKNLPSIVYKGYKDWSVEFFDEKIEQLTGVEVHKINSKQITMLDLIDELKNINPVIKVLLSSGFSKDGQAQDILNRGCNGFIQKPFNINKLSCKLRDVLDI